MHIRLTQPADIDAIFAVTRDSFAGLAKDHYTMDQVARWMDGCTPSTYLAGVEKGRTHVAEIDRQVIGYMEAVPGEITNLFVSPRAAGRGIGAKLLHIGLGLARQDHTGPIMVESLLNAVPFYEKFGFVRIGPGFSSHGTALTPPIEIMKMELAA